LLHSCAHVAAAILVLHTGDVPHGFVRHQAGGSAASYTVEFVRPTTLTGLQEGPLLIESSAVRKTSAAAAHSALRHSVPRGAPTLAVGYRVGDEAREYVVELGSTVGALLRYTLVWRDASVFASVVVVGRVGVVSAADLAPLVRAQEARIKAATRARRSCRSGS
jgi:hypothetical protein